MNVVEQGMRRLVLLPLVVLSVLLLGFVGATCAAADDPPLPVMPPGVPGPSEVLGGDVGDLQAPAGPTYDVTPGSSGTSLTHPDRAVDDARRALGRVKGAQGAAGSGKKGVEVAGPVAPASAPASDGSGTAHPGWWAAGAALLLLVVLAEIRRAARRRRPV